MYNALKITFFAMLMLFGNDGYADEIAEKPTPPATEKSPATKTPEFYVFPIGINNDSRNIVPSALVRGAEDGKQAINLEDWLIPLEAVTTALNIKTRTLDDGQIELRSPEIAVRLSEQQIHKDKEIGTSLSVAYITHLLNATVSFDIGQYALVLKLPAGAAATNDTQQETKKVISFEGLETIQPDRFNFSAVTQHLHVSSQKKTVNISGNLLAVGNLDHGSWYVDINQAVMDKPESWRVQDLQYFWKTDDADYVIGSQPTFWQNQSGGDFWGVTLLKRDDFKNVPQSTGGFDPVSRRTTGSIGRTITGQAQPNTLARLVDRSSNDRMIAEVFVDSSGLYTFNNVLSNAGSINEYDILLYPNGILTAEPERVRSSFVSRATQLQQGTSTWVVSGGINRSLSTNTANGSNNQLNQGNGTTTKNKAAYSLLDSWGHPIGFAGGASYRYGLFESLTVGAGLVYSNGWQLLAEYFYSPSWFPYVSNIVALYDFKTGKYDYNSQAQLQLLDNLSANFTSTPLAKQAFLNWNALSWLTFSAGGAVNSSTTATVKPRTWFAGTTANGRFYETSASINANFDSNAVLRISSSVNRDAWAVGYQWDGSRQKLDLSYKFPESEFEYANGHSLNISAETNKTTASVNKFGMIVWQYRPPAALNDGRILADVQIGYGMGTQGQGLLASLSTVMIPGVELSANYQDISIASNDRQFSLNIYMNGRVEPTLGLSNRSSSVQELRGIGGLFIQPFLDKNDNGQYDDEDSLYLENSDRLLQIDGYPVTKHNIEIGLQGLYISQQAGKCRLDLDPAGYPVEGKPSQESYAVEVPSGAYVTVLIPFSVTYTIAGRVLDAQGNPVDGVKVDAVLSEKGNKGSAISNGAGVFFIDSLHQGKYQLIPDGQAAHSETVEIKSDSKTMLEVTLKK
ncbi:MAG: carboxypeptidase-like regulatory domain-containing protein [Methylococcales bacterium]|nr:carboxypeptidase-like regulatory domain-containing protein [Methylococcales bacterium]